MATVAKRYPREFRDDVVRVARRHDAPISQIAKDFGISDATLYEWMKKADVDDGVRPGLSEADAAEMRELRRRNRVLEQEVEVLRRATAYFAKDHSPK
jgi:transposase